MAIITHRESRLLKASEDIQSEIFGELAFSHSLLCQLGLPYRNPGKVRHFERSSGRLHLRLEAGSIMTPTGWKEVGLPYATRARLLMVHLCSMAIKNQSPVVEASESFTQFCRDLGLVSPSGATMRAIKEQIDRMSAVSMRFAYTSDTNIDVFQGSVFDAVRMETAHADGQRLLWDNQFRFNQSFFDSLVEHSVPLDLRALKALRHSSRGIDVYCWLASRLYRIPRSRSTKIRWTSLRFQFGNPQQDLDSFKRAFREVLKQVLVVYKEASSSVEVVRGGIRLKYAQPPVPLKTFNSLPTVPDKAF